VEEPFVTPGETAPGQAIAAIPGAGVRRLACPWRSPDGQPRWARPALLGIMLLAAAAYASNLGGQQPEVFYAAAVRSMAGSWRDFFYGAFDPLGTVSVDKVPGALWVQALSVRLFGLHLWAINLPQAVEGVLTVPFLYRGVRRLCGARAAICAASIGALTPAVVALDRGNVSDSLLILLLVLAFDAVSAALVSGSLAPAVLAGLFVGLAFQAKMLEAWLVLPGILGTLLLAAPGTLRRRLLAGAALLAVAVVVSLSWMTVVSAMPRQDRPYVDGTTNDSVYEQVFEYDGFGRAAASPLSAGGIVAPLRLVTLDEGSRAQRVISGAGGRDAGYLLPAAAAGLIAGLIATRRRPRTDRVRAACVLWGWWLAVDVAAFLTVDTINAYYLAALAPATGALVGIGVELAARRSAERRRPPVLVLLVALAMASAAYAFWLLAPAPLAVRVAALAAAAGCVTLALALPRRALPLLVAAVTVAPVIAGIEVIAASGGPFDTAFEPAAIRQLTGADVARVVRYSGAAASALAIGAGSRYLAGAYTSALASPFIYASGEEILPIGGFDGTTPVPSVATLRADVASGALHTVLLVPTRDPRVAWVVRTCRRVPTRVSVIQTYYCGSPVAAPRGLEHVYGEAGFGARDALLAGSAVGHGQQAADAAGDGVLGEGRVGELAQFFQAGLPVSHPQLAGHRQVLRRVVTEDLEGALDARAGRHRGARAAAQVGVIEVRQPVGGGPDLAPHPPFLPGQHGLVGTEPGQHGADRLAVPDDHAVHAAHIPRLGVHLQPAGGAHQGEGRL
jgi:4-amino-4-deoxy-L-arabinose transferase-like glycosyltransferase